MQQNLIPTYILVTVADLPDFNFLKTCCLDICFMRRFMGPPYFKVQLESNCFLKLIFSILPYKWKLHDSDWLFQELWLFNFAPIWRFPSNLDLWICNEIEQSDVLEDIQRSFWLKMYLSCQAKQLFVFSLKTKIDCKNCLRKISHKKSVKLFWMVYHIDLLNG